MTCYSPIKGWRSKDLNESGKRGIVFNPAFGFQDMPVEVPCGQCIGCRLDRSRSWALRCMHEASLHSANSFITLTYDSEHLPANANLNVGHFQKFMKRLRKHLYPNKIRFFQCGEYGSNDMDNPDHRVLYGLSALGRPHYHSIIFGYDFPDRVLLKKTQQGHYLYTSPLLTKLWPFGYNTIGDVTFDSAAYVARYVVKKVNGELAEDHYTRVNPDTGEVVGIKPEYTTMSRKPGIASDWFNKYKGDVYPKDFTTLKGKIVRPPKYYDALLEKEDIALFEKIKAKRTAYASKDNPDTTYERLIQRENVKKAQAKMLKRKLD